MTEQQAMMQRVINFIDTYPAKVDMSNWYADGRMCIAGVTYMLSYGEDALIEAQDSSDCDVIERVAKQSLGLDNKDLFHNWRWSTSNQRAYVKAKTRNDQRGMADATIAEIRRYI